MRRRAGNNDRNQSVLDVPGKHSKDTEDSRGHAPTHDETQLRAYWIHLDRGGEHGSDLEDWLQAERELTGESPEDPNIKVRPDRSSDDGI